MTMSDRARAEYEAVLRKVIAKHGSVVREKPTWYGWTASALLVGAV